MLRNKKVALIGCGDIGQRLAKLLMEDSAKPVGFRRQTEHIKMDMPVVAVDVTDQASVAILSQQRFDYAVISLTPNISAKNKDQDAVANAYQHTYQQGLKNILAHLNMDSLKKVFWVSSTSVFAQDDHSWINEHSETQPSRTSGQCLLAAEGLMKPLADKGCIIRFAGIYRDGSHRLLKQLQQGLLAAGADRDYFTNRIHVQDCARMIHFLMKEVERGAAVKPIYIGVDDSPVLFSELNAYLSEQTGLPLNTRAQAKKPAVGSKRCSNALIRAAGFDFLYANYKEGFAPLIQQLKSVD